MDTEPNLAVTDEAVLAGLHGWNEQFTPPSLDSYKVEEVKHMRQALAAALPILLATRSR